MASFQVPSILASLSAIFLAYLVQCEGIANGEITHIENIKPDEFPAMRSRSSVTIVYFLQDKNKVVLNFLEEYEKSAAVLKLYSVVLAKVDCQAISQSGGEEYCNKDGADQNLYVFREGHELLVLPLENTFDVNSIVSNVLQIVLIRDVPILQTLDERQEFEEHSAGHYDVIFSFQTAIGTQEHRSFMEVAFAYKNKYRFAITTETPVVTDLIGSGTGESAMLWLFKCKDVRPGNSCTRSKYRDNIDLISLVRYLRALETVYDASTTGATGGDDRVLHEVYMYYDTGCREEVQGLTFSLKKTFEGVVRFTLVDIQNKLTSDLLVPDITDEVPAAVMRLRGHEEPFFMPGDEFSALAVEAFISQVLQTTLRERPSLDDFNVEDEEEALLAGVEKQDDQVAEAVSRLAHVEFDRTYIPALTDKTFSSHTTDTHLTIVLFYLTFDAKSMAFMRSYIDASIELAKENIKVLTGVDCFDWTDVCGKNNITTYPTIRIYRKGKNFRTYEGLLGTIPIIRLVKTLLSNSPVELSTLDDHDRFVQGKYPSVIYGVSEVSAVGLFTEEDVKELSSFKRVANLKVDSMLLAYSTPDLTKILCTQYGIVPPAVIVHKRHDVLEKMRIFQNNIRTSTVLKFLEEASLSLYPEITPVNFPAYYVQKKPFVILFDENIDEGQGAHREVASVAASKELPEFIFGWMELTRDDGIGGKILLEYNRHAEPPSLFVVDHSKGIIYNYQEDAVTKGQVFDWLKRVRKDDIKPWKALQKGDWKPLNPGYDFLKMIDAENAEEQSDGQLKSPSVSRRFGNVKVQVPPSTEEEKRIRLELHAFQGEKEEPSDAHSHSEL